MIVNGTCQAGKMRKSRVCVYVCVYTNFFQLGWGWSGISNYEFIFKLTHNGCPLKMPDWKKIPYKNSSDMKMAFK